MIALPRQITRHVLAFQNALSSTAIMKLKIQTMILARVNQNARTKSTAKVARSPTTLFVTANAHTMLATKDNIRMNTVATALITAQD